MARTARKKDYDVSLVPGNVRVGNSPHRIGRREDGVQKRTRADYADICRVQSVRPLIRYVSN
jgi:hypothetical protein